MLPNVFLNNPVSGTLIFGVIDAMKSRGVCIEGGEIRLKRGRHGGPYSGFGAAHIWAEHEQELRQRGFLRLDDVPAYVASIIQPGAPVFCEFAQMRGAPRLTVVRSPTGMAVLQLFQTRGSPHYSVVTAYSNAKAHGTRVGTVR